MAFKRVLPILAFQKFCDSRAHFFGRRCAAEVRRQCLLLHEESFDGRQNPLAPRFFTEEIEHLTG